MASPPGRCPSSLAERLLAKPQGFEFFQAVRLLRQMAARTRQEPVPDLTDVVRFRTWLSLRFPASAIFDLVPPRTIPEQEAAESEKAWLTPEMVVTFLGLVGPSGVLPRHYTEMLLERLQGHRDQTAHVFLDLFNHRILSLFHQAWEKYRFYIAYEQGNRETFTRHILDLVGVGTTGLSNRLVAGSTGVVDEALIYYGGLLAQRPPSAAALAAVLGDYLGVPVAVEQCLGGWLSVNPADRTRLGRANASLGETAFVGNRVWDWQSRFRLRIGPLRWDQFEDLLPGGRGHIAAARLTRFHVGVSFDFDLQLVLRAEDVPSCRLGTGGPRLGWSTWLKTAPFKHPAENAKFSITEWPTP
ncbi:MAG: type VI secretion system baseplate subunit TssG [Pseudomonadota bacterium]